VCSDQFNFDNDRPHKSGDSHFQFPHQGLGQECKPSQLLPFDLFKSPPPPPPAGLKGHAKSIEGLLEGLQFDFCLQWDTNGMCTGLCLDFPG
jgi:hypothetical protein